MVKTIQPGALAVTAGTLVAVGLLMLMMLVVEVQPAEAVDGEARFNVTNNDTDDFTPAYSPIGEKIVYRAHVRSLMDIYTINADGTGNFNVTNGTDTTAELDPYYSPDGEKIAYAGWDGNDTEIYTINADGGERTQLTNNTTNELELSYSPDGKRIAYEGYDGHDTEIYTITVGPARSVNQVTHNTVRDTDPSYSPDGRRIAYAGYDGQFWEIYTISVGGDRRHKLTNQTTTTWKETDLAYSPDGEEIAYTGIEIDNVDSRKVRRDPEIYTITVGPAHKVVQVTHNFSKDEEPTYSPDGEKIAYQARDGHDWEIYTINADGGG